MAGLFLYLDERFSSEILGGMTENGLRIRANIPLIA